jgi:hypothetical protein
MNRITLTASVVLLLTAIAPMSFASKTPADTKPKVEKVEFDPNFQFDLDILHNDNFAKMFDNVKTSRKISQSVIDVPAIEQTFSEDFNDLRAKLIGGQSRSGRAVGVKTPEELDLLIKEISSPKIYQSLSPQAKFLALQLKGLQPYKSFIYRARVYFGKNTALRSYIITMLRGSSTAINTFFPTDSTNPTNQWNVVFRYVTEPMEDMGPEITTDEQLHNFVLTLVKVNAGLLKDMVGIYNTTDQIWWDNKIYMSFANFTSEKDRYIKLGKPEMETLLAAGLAGFSGLTTSAAYSFSGLSSAIKTTAQYFGVDSIQGTIGKGVEGLSSRDRFSILKKHPQLFNLIPGGGALMATSKSALVSSVRFARLSWESLKKSGSSDRGDFLFDPRVVIPFNRILGVSFETLDDLLSDQGVKSTVVAGEMVKINLSEFYKNPPQQLSELYPVTFKDGPDEKVKNIKNQPLKYRDYSVGRSLAWKGSAYQRYFPDIKIDSNGQTSDVPNYARILSQTWGGAGFGALISSMVF